MRMQRYGFLMFCVGVCAFSAAARAQDVLREDAIRNLYDESIKVQLAGAKETVDFFERHMHADGKIVMHLVSRVKGATTEKSTHEYTKAQMLAETKKTYDTSRFLNIEGNVIAVKIAQDGQSATVKSSMVASVITRVPSPQGIMALNMEQSALCDDVVVLSPQNVIQITQSTCNAEAMIELPPQ